MTEPQQNWSTPDADLIRRALSRLGDVQHRRVFYEKLENPLWVDALDARGAFDSPPELIMNEDGSAQSVPWPEGGYLIRMASAVPASVARILKRTSSSTNPYVRETVLRAANAMPPDYAAQLAKSVARFLVDGSLSHADEVVDLADRLARGGQPKSAMHVLQAAFRPRASGEEATGLGGRRSVRTGLERYWVEARLADAVKVLVAIQGEKALTTLVSWLEAFMVTSGEYSSDRPYDLSHIWRPAIGPHEQNQGTEELGDALVDAVRDLAVAQVLGGRDAAQVVEVLERNSQPLSQRIAIHVLSVTAPGSESARAVGHERLLMPFLLEAAYRHEYTGLARVLLPTADESQRAAWSGTFEAGPNLDDAQMTEAAQYWRLDDETLEESKIRYRELWRHKLLSGIGRDSLFQPYVDELTRLEERYGAMDHAEFSAYSTTWVGPGSPVTEEGLMSYGAAELAEYLRTWTPERSNPPNPSKEGLARVFQTAVAKRSEELSASASLFDDLDPTYMRAYFSGLGDALRNGESVSWEEILNLAAAVAQKTDDGAEVDGSMDEDLVWRFAQRSIAALIEQGARSEDNGIPDSQLMRAVDVLEPLVSHPDPTVAHEERYGGSNMDPLTLSLNTTRPAVMRALITVAARAKELLGGDQSGDPSPQVVPRVLELIDGRLQPERDFSLAEAAALGEGLGRLVWIDREWTEARLPHLLSADAFGDVVGSTALATYQPSRVLLEVLSPWARALVERVARGEELVSGWRQDRGPLVLLGDHLMMLRLWDAIPPDADLLTTYFERAPVEARAKVLGHVGWLLSRSEVVPEEPLQRAMSLMDMRAEAIQTGAADPRELSEFYWWARSGKFPPEWWLPILERAVRLPGFDARGMLGEVLEETATTAPGTVVRVLEQLLIQGREEPFGRFDLINHAPGILATAFDSADRDAITVADRVLDLLGRAGHLRVAELVATRRRQE